MTMICGGGFLIKYFTISILPQILSIGTMYALTYVTL